MNKNDAPVIEEAPAAPPANGTPDLHVTPELVRELLVGKRIEAGAAAISDWVKKAHDAAELKQNADDDENKAFQELPQGTTEAMRKAHAKLQSGKSRLAAEHAAIDARAAERLVDLLVGGGRS